MIHLQEDYGYSQEELKGFQLHFKRLDLDSDGHISINELRRHFKDMGVRVTARTLSDLIYEVDTNRNGQVEFEEFVQLMYRMKKGGSTNWKNLLDFTKPVDRQGTFGRATRHTLRFLGATPAHDFEHDQQWQNYSFFNRVDLPQQPSRGKSILRSLNPFRKNEDDAPGPSNRAYHAPVPGGNSNGRNLVEVTILKDDEEVKDVDSDSSYEYYSDSDDEDILQSAPLGSRAQRLSQLVQVRPASGAVLSPSASNVHVSAPVSYPQILGASAPVPSAPLLEPVVPPAHSSSPRDSPTVAAEDDEEDQEYQRRRRQQMEQHRIILENQERMRREMAAAEGNPGNPGNPGNQRARPHSMEIPLVPMNSNLGVSPSRPVSTIIQGNHRSSFLDETQGVASAPAARPGSPAGRPGSPQPPSQGVLTPPDQQERPQSPGARQAHPQLPEHHRAPASNILNARRNRRKPLPRVGDEETSAEEVPPPDTRRRSVARSQPQRRKTAKTKRSKRVDLVLQDPKVRQQLAKKKSYRPYFMLVVMLVELAMMGYALILNQGFEQMTVNPFGGPSVITLVQLGAKFAPCMRSPTVATLEYFKVQDFHNGTIMCPAAFPGNRNGSECNLEDVLSWLCGMGGFPDGVPLQWWRFFTAMFTHTGLIHLGVIIIFQFRIGFVLEQEVGPIRVFFIYIISGLLGNTFAANMAPHAVTCGANGALFGIFALLLIDLLQNWPLLLTPWRNLITLVVICLFVLAIGLLPFIDNYASLGGFAGGILTGLILMPTITFGTWDGRRKKILLGVAVLVLAALLFAGFYSFYDGNETSFCLYCTYLDCVPPNAPWCNTF